jgi:flavorubredoxin
MTRIDEIAPEIYRISTFIEQAGLAFDQFLVVADEPLLFHTGLGMLYPGVAEAVRRVMPVERLRWITFGHYEADECGAMNHWLADAPNATVAHGQIAVMLSIMDQAVRPPRVLADGEVLDLGGKRVRFIATPHVPHGWDAGLLYEETTNTLFAGDLFTAFGDGPATTAGDIVGPAVAMEDAMHATALTPLTAPTIRRLAELNPSTLALMHAPAFTGDGAQALRDLAGVYAARLEAAVPA